MRCEVDQRVDLAGRVLGVSTGAADQAFRLPAGSVDPATLADRGRGARPEATSRGSASTISARSIQIRTSRAKPPSTSSTRPPACCASATACAAACPSARCASGWRSAASAAARAGNLARRQPDRALGHAGRRPQRARHQGRSQPLAADGGADAETLAQAEQRIPAYLRHRDRARHGRGLPQPRLRDARPRRRARRGAAALQAARPPLRRAPAWSA